MGEIAALITGLSKLLIPVGVYIAHQPGQAGGLFVAFIVGVIFVAVYVGKDKKDKEAKSPLVRMAADLPQSATSGQWHILTFAETGFAALNFYGETFGISRDDLERFSKEVNARDETGTLFPRAPISVVPRAYVRDQIDSVALAGKIVTFLQMNRDAIHAPRLLIDFRAGVAPFVLVAIKSAIEFPFDEELEEVVIIDSN